MPGSSFGHIFRVTTFGESHGHAVGVIVDGVPPQLPLEAAEIQVQLDRRKPGQSDITTSRQEADLVHLLSGVFEGKTTGTSLAMILYNKDARPDAYLTIKDSFRPGHADYSYLKKYGIRDWRGSGRASGRETAGRVAAGAIARKLLERRGVTVLAWTREAAGIACRSFDESAIEKNPLRAPDMAAAEEMQQRLLQLKEEQNSAGGVIECRIRGVRPGLGEPVFDKLDAELAHAVLSIGATKAIAFGSGFDAARMTGREHNDEMNSEGFLSNHAGGILGGISTGQDIVFRVAVKPASSIAQEQRTVTVEGEETSIKTEGRHDTCICPRVVPVVEAMACIALEDHYRRLESYAGSGTI